MKYIFFLLLAVALQSFTTQNNLPQPYCSASENSIPQTKEERQQWFNEMREIKHQYLIKELNLTKEQQKSFFPLYDKMENENQKIQHSVRAMEKRVYELGSEASDLDYEKATDALYEAKQKESEIEMRYRNEFKNILTPEQLFKLKGAERKFSRQLMDKRFNIKKK